MRALPAQRIPRRMDHLMHLSGSPAGWTTLPLKFIATLSPDDIVFFFAFSRKLPSVLAAYSLAPGFPTSTSSSVSFPDGYLGLAKPVLPDGSDSVLLPILEGKVGGPIANGYFYIDGASSGASSNNELVLTTAPPDESKWFGSHGGNWLTSLSGSSKWAVLTNSLTLKGVVGADGGVSDVGAAFADFVVFDFGAGDWVVAPGADYATLAKGIVTVAGAGVVGSPLVVPCEKVDQLPVLEFVGEFLLGGFLLGRFLLGRLVSVGVRVKMIRVP